MVDNYEDFDISLDALPLLDTFCKDDEWRSQSYSRQCTLRRALMFCAYRLPWNSNLVKSCRVYFNESTPILLNSTMNSVFEITRSANTSSLLTEMFESNLVCRFSVVIDGKGNKIYLNMNQNSFIRYNSSGLKNTLTINGSSIIVRNLEFIVKDSNDNMDAVFDIDGTANVVFENIRCVGTSSINSYLSNRNGPFCGRLRGIKNVKLMNMIAMNNIGWNGGSFEISWCGNIEIRHSLFINNTALNMGGSLAIFNISSNVEIHDCRFIENSASSFGGGIALNNILGKVSVKNSLFELGYSQFGSAIVLASCSNAIFCGNLISKNIAVESGSLYWITDTMTPPVMQYPGCDTNIFESNSALSYGPDLSSSYFRMKVFPEIVDVESYQTGSFNLQVNISVVDYYSNVIVHEDQVVLLAWTNQKKANCGFNLAVLNGQFSGVLHNGSSYMNELNLNCFPGGTANVTFSSSLLSMSCIYPLYNKNLFFSLTKSRLWRNSKYRRIRSVDVIVNFRRCVRGEIFDVYSVLKSTCSKCRDSYSLDDNLGVYALRCSPCPSLAKWCGDYSLVLGDGYWRSDLSSNSIVSCPLLNSCRGGNWTGSDICYTGYAGAFCGYCSIGYYLSMDMSCISCQTTSSIDYSGFQFIFIIFLLILICISILIWVLKRSRSETTRQLIAKYVGIWKNDRSNSKYLSKLKILISSLQTMSLSLPKSVVWSSNISIFRYLSFLQLDYTLLFPMECYQPYNFVDRIMNATLLPLLVYSLLTILVIMERTIYGIYHIGFDVKSDEKKKPTWTVNKLMKILVISSYYLLPTISLKLFQFFDCVAISYDGGKTSKYLRMDSSIDCSSSYYFRSELFSVAMILVYPIGVPILYYLLLQQHGLYLENRLWIEKISKSAFIQTRRLKYKEFDRTETANDLIRSLDFLYVSYKPKYWYWDVFEVWKRLLFSAVLVAVIQSDISRLVVYLFCTVMLMLLYSYCRPYNLQSDNDVNDISNYQSLFLYLVALISMQDSLSAWKDSNYYLSLAMMTLNIGLGIGILYYGWQDEYERENTIAPKEDGFELDELMNHKTVDHFVCIGLENAFHLFYFREVIRKLTSFDMKIACAVLLTRLIPLSESKALSVPILSISFSRCTAMYRHNVNKFNELGLEVNSSNLFVPIELLDDMVLIDGTKGHMKLYDFDELLRCFDNRELSSTWGSCRVHDDFMLQNSSSSSSSSFD